MPNSQIVPSILFTSVTGEKHHFAWTKDTNHGQPFVEDITNLTEVLPKTPQALASTLSGCGHEYIIHHKKANDRNPSRIVGVVKMVGAQEKENGLLCTVKLQNNQYRSFYWHDLFAVYQIPYTDGGGIIPLTQAMSHVRLVG